MGTIYQRGKKRTWWIKYYRAGKPFYESTRSTRKKDATDLLAVREGQIVKGEFTGVRAYKLRFDEMCDDYLRDYRVNGKRTLAWAERRVKRLKAVFGGWRAMDVGPSQIKAYIDARQREHASNATINRELTSLKRMFNLAIGAGKLYHKPSFKDLMLQEANPRAGFFGGEVEYLALMAQLPDRLKPLVAFAYTYGWRKEEVLGLTWDRVDLSQGIVRLDPGTTKNRQGRTVVLTDSLREILKAQWESARAIVVKGNPEATPAEIGKAIPWVFHHHGKPIREFRQAWNGACKRAKLPGRLFHDLRRTAVRNMIRAGIPDVVAMKISGHKTRSVFDRYNIVAEADLHEAAKRLEPRNSDVTAPTLPDPTLPYSSLDRA